MLCNIVNLRSTNELSPLRLAQQAPLRSGFFMAQWEEYHTGTLPTSYGAALWQC